MAAVSQSMSAAMRISQVRRLMHWQGLSRSLQSLNVRTIPKACYCSQVTADNGISEEEVDEILQIRNVSRLPQKLYQKKIAMEAPPLLYEHHFTKKWHRKLYAKYGKASGINAGVGWPTLEELDEIVEDEKEWDPSLAEMVANIQAKDTEIQRRRQYREDLVKKNMAKMPEYIAQYEKRLQKEQDAKKKSQEKKQRLMDEARDFFGYDIDPRDERFKQMQEMKAEEEKKLAKKRKKEEKMKKSLLRLGIEAESSGS